MRHLSLVRTPLGCSGPWRRSRARDPLAVDPEASPIVRQRLPALALSLNSSVSTQASLLQASAADVLIPSCNGAALLLLVSFETALRGEIPIGFGRVESASSNGGIWDNPESR